MSNAAGQAGVGLAGTLAGSFIGGPIGGLVGGIAGSILGQYLFPIDSVNPARPDVSLPGANPGTPLSIPFGTVYIETGELSWADEPTFKEITQSNNPFKGFGETTTGYKVFISFGIIVCEGPATVLKIWRNGKLIYGLDDDGFPVEDVAGTLRFYDGSASQEPDPKELEIFGEDDTSAHPGTCYVVFEDHEISDGFPTLSFLVTRVATPAPPFKRIPPVEVDLNMTFSTPSDDRRFTYGWDDRAGGVLYKVDNVTKEYVVQRTSVSEISQHSATNTSESSPDTNNGPPAINNDGDFYVIQTKNAFPGTAEIHKFSGETLELLDSSGDITPSGNFSGRGFCQGIGWTGIRGAVGVSIEETLVAALGDEVRGRDASNLTINRWSVADSTYESKVSLTLRTRPCITTGPDGHVWIIYRSSGGNGDPLHFAIFKQNHLTGEFLFEDSITIIDTDNISLGHVAWYQWDLDAICIIADGQSGDPYAFVKYFPADGTFEEVSVSDGLVRWHSNVHRIQGLLSGLADSTVHWIGEKGAEYIFRRWDWTQMAFVETCDLSNTVAGLPLTPTEGSIYDEVSQTFQFVGEDATWEDHFFIACDGAVGNGTNLCAVTQIVSQKVGMDITTMLNCADVVSVEIPGALIRDPQDAREFLSTLYRIHNAYLADGEDYMVHGRRRGGGSILTIAPEEVGAHVGGKPPDRLVERADRRPRSLPKRLEISFQDLNADYQQNVQGFNRSEEITDSIELNSEQYPGALDVTRAKEVMKQRLKSLWINSTTFETSLPPYYWLLTPGDVVTLPMGDINYEVEVAELNVGQTGLANLKGVKWDSAVLNNQNIIGQPSPIPPQTIEPPGIIAPQVFDIPLLTDAHENNAAPIRYVGASSSSGNLGVGVVIQTSSDNETWTDYVVIDKSNLLPIGTLTANLAATSTPYVIDKTNTISLNLPDGTQLASAASEAAWLADETINVAILVADDGAFEILRYQDAVAGTGSSWTLSNLLRGQRNTENHQVHSVGKNIFFITGSNLSIKTFSAMDIGSTLYFRAVPLGSASSNAPSVAHVPVGRSKMPYSPSNITFVLDGSPTDWDGEMMARSRFDSAPPMDDPPIGETIFEFELDVLDAAQTGNVLLTLTTTPLANGSVIVTSQATGRIQKIKIAEGDMLTSPAEIIHDLHVAAYQLSAFVGRGEPGYASFSSGSPEG
jgi:hypothetical protein